MKVFMCSKESKIDILLLQMKMEIYLILFQLKQKSLLMMSFKYVLKMLKFQQTRDR